MDNLKSFKTLNDTEVLSQTCNYVNTVLTGISETVSLKCNAQFHSRSDWIKM